MDISAPNTFGTHKGVVVTHSLFVALATFLLALLSLSLSSEARHFTPLWFPTAAAIAVLYRHAPRHWGLPLLASGLGIVLASWPPSTCWKRRFAPCCCAACYTRTIR